MQFDIVVVPYGLALTFNWLFRAPGDWRDCNISCKCKSEARLRDVARDFIQYTRGSKYSALFYLDAHYSVEH